MSDVYFERLSFLDTTFLAMEDRNAHFHVAGVMIFEPGNLVASDGTVDVERIRDFVESHLHQIRRYRQVLMFTPITNQPVWVDDEHFDINYHVRHTSLPSPGGEEELKQLAGRVFSEKLDRWRPLWEMWVVEGLEDGRFALIAKVHHAMIDGIAGVDLLNYIMSPFPLDEFEPPRPFEPRPAPSRRQLLRSEVFRYARAPLAMAKGMGHFVTTSREMTEEVVHRVRAATKALGSGWLYNASDTPLNRRIGPNRLFEWTVTDLAEVKKVKNVLGGTVNDVILATVAGAVRTFLQKQGADPAELHIRAMAPVSVRTEAQQGALGNQVAMWLVDLPVGEPDPVRRLELIQSATAELKETEQALGAATLVQATSWTPNTILQSAARFASSTGAMRPFNLTVTNVPGPQIPIYLLGAELVVQYPLVPLWFNHGIGVALFSYNGEVAWGFNADAETVPDVAAFADAVDASFRQLFEAALVAAGEKAEKGSGRAAAKAARPRSRKAAAEEA